LHEPFWSALTATAIIDGALLQPGHRFVQASPRAETPENQNARLWGHWGGMGPAYAKKIRKSIVRTTARTSLCGKLFRVCARTGLTAASCQGYPRPKAFFQRVGLSVI